MLRLRIYVRYVVFVVFLGIITVCFQPHVSAGQTIDMANTANWNLRFDGAVAGDYLSHFCTISDDFDGDGKKDIAIGALSADNNSRSGSGSLYIIYNTLLRTFANGSTIDLSDPSHYNIRFDGELAGDSLGDMCTSGDVNNDGKIDLITNSMYADNNSRSSSGSMYVIFNNLFSGYTGTGNNVDMADSSHYNLRFDADSASAQLASSGVQIKDIDGNGKADLIFGEGYADHNSRTDSGSVFIILDSLIDNYAGTGNNIDLAVSTNYNIRFDGAGASEKLSHFAMACEDINHDSRLDLAIAASRAGYNSRVDSGSVFVIYNSVFSHYVGTGNNVDLAVSSNYNLRIDSPSAGETLGSGGIIAKDINSDGMADLLLGALGYAGNTGAVYVLDNDRFSGYVGTGNNIDLATPANYNLRIEGTTAVDLFGYFIFKSPLADINNDGRVDLFVTARTTDYNSRTDSGSLYVFSNTLISSYTTTGNRINLSNDANFTLRYDGAGAGDWLSYLRSFALSDLNGDGSADLLVGANTADNNSRTDSGSLYVIYNFPHTSTVTSATRSGSTATIKGTIAAPNSVATIVGVQYRVDSNSPSGTWKNCTANDGTFDSLSEAYTCTVSNAPATAGKHKIYIRALDSKGEYTAVASYKTYQYSIAASKNESSSLQVTPTLTVTPSPTATLFETPTNTPTTISGTPTGAVINNSSKYGSLPCMGIVLLIIIVLILVILRYIVGGRREESSSDEKSTKSSAQ